MPTKKPSKKSVKKTAKPIAKKIKKNSSEAEIMALTHAGTKESVAKLKTMIEKESDSEKKGFLELALEESEMFYFEPTNEQEERDFNLAKLIYDQQKNWLRQDVERSALLCRVDFLRLKLEVREKILKDASAAEKEMAQVQRDVAHEILIMEEDRLAKAEDQESAADAFIKAAEKMIKNEKYKKLPYDFFDHYHFDDEELDGFFDDEDCCDCGECDCGCCDDDSVGFTDATTGEPFCCCGECVGECDGRCDKESESIKF